MSSNADLKSKAIGWTEYLMGHLLRAKNNPNELVICDVPSEAVKKIIEEALYQLLTQTDAAWQIEVRITTVH